MVQKNLDKKVREKFFKGSRDDGRSPRDPVFQLLLAAFHRKIIGRRKNRWTEVPLDEPLSIETGANLTVMRIYYRINSTRKKNNMNFVSFII